MWVLWHHILLVEDELEFKLLQMKKSQKNKEAKKWNALVFRTLMCQVELPSHKQTRLDISWNMKKNILEYIYVLFLHFLVFFPNSLIFPNS